MKFWSMSFSIALFVTTVVLLAEIPSSAGQSPHMSENPLMRLGGLVNLCQRNDATSKAICGSYITGFVAGCQATQYAAVVHAVGDAVISGKVAPTDSAIENASNKLIEQSKLFCIGSNWTAGYVQAIVVQYGREHPEALKNPTADEMLKILAKAFPCSKR